MGTLHNLKLRFSPPRIVDPDFGSLRFMYVPNAPERSYWESEWIFPNTDTAISIGLDGGESGPLPEAREFYLSLPDRFEQIIAAARPRLTEVFKTWLQQAARVDAGHLRGGQARGVWSGGPENQTDPLGYQLRDNWREVARDYDSI